MPGAKVTVRYIRAYTVMKGRKALALNVRLVEGTLLMTKPVLVTLRSSGNRQISTIAARSTAPVSHQFPMITQAPSIPAKMAMAAIDRLSLITLT